MGRVTVSYDSQEEFEAVLNVMRGSKSIHITKVTNESQGARRSKKYIHYFVSSDVSKDE